MFADVVHRAAEPMHLTSQPRPNPWAPDDRRHDVFAEYTVQLCSNCGASLYIGSRFGVWPALAYVVSSRYGLAGSFAATAVTCAPAVARRVA